MKKSILTLSLIGLFHLAFSQTVKFGITGGLTLSTVNYSSPSLTLNGVSVSTSPLVGFNVGVLADITLGNFSIQPAVLYTTKASKTTSTATYGEDGPSVASGTTTLNFIEVPVNIIYNIPVEKAGKVFFGAGPFIAYGTGGTSKSGDNSANINFGNNSGDGLSNPDLGVNILAGFRFNSGLFFSAGYEIGLANLETNDAKESDPGSKFNTRSAHLSIGYFFK
jgi:hypothetical protein